MMSLPLMTSGMAWAWIGRRLGVALVEHGAQQFGRQAEVGEGDFGGGVGRNYWPPRYWQRRQLTY
jgi:hypothetical protein